MARILLVDDDPVTLRLLQAYLAADGHTILTAADGAEACQKIWAERPDLILLDVMMPEVDGFRVLNRVKTDPEIRDTIVVMLTARDDAQDMALGLDVGADYYLAKPFDPADVTSLVRRIFSARDG
jgi:two-component system, OmpR family, alkaline phosphatase synthesis response regulator PhoP